MTQTRLPAVAGTFYPGNPVALSTMIDAMLAEGTVPDAISPPVALVVPHAGYVYSGPTAAIAYVRLRPWAGQIDRVVVMGPSHRVPLRGLGLSSADFFTTPLGDIPIDRAACDALLTHPGVHINDEAHQYEHSVEVQLPFLQRVLGDGWSLVPIVAGSGTASSIADAVGRLWAAPHTLFIISTDLSHYHDLNTARQVDRATAVSIISAAWESLGSDEACGVVPVRGALELARRHGERVSLLDLRTSADTAGPPERVVGYGSFLVR